MKKSVSTPQRVRCDGASTMASGSICRSGLRRPSRPSIASALGRRSSIQEGKKETKAPNDRQSLQKNLTVLTKFLSDNNYTHLGGASHNLNKVLNSPSARDVSTIFQYLISLMGIEYSRDKKFEDEFPRIMKLLTYPFVISKRQLQAVGSMHNWPSIAHALSWICNFYKTYKSIDDDLPDFPKEEDDDMLKYLEFQVDCQAYNCFLQGEDDHSALDKDFSDKLPALMGMDKLKELSEKMTLLSEKKEEIQKQKEFCSETVKENVLLAAESKKFYTYICEMNAFASKLDAHIATLTEEGKKKGIELESLKSAVCEKKNKIAKQRITVHEVQALEMVAENLKSQMDEKESALGKLQAEVVTSEALLMKENDELHAVIDEYHSISRDCGLIPESACNAQGYDYSIQLPKPESDTSSSNIDDINRRLQLILRQCKESSRGLRLQEMKSLEEIQRLQGQYASKVEDVDFINAKIRRQQEAIEVVKHEFASEVLKLREAIAQVEEEIMTLSQRNKGSHEIEALQETNMALLKEVMQLEENARVANEEVETFMFTFCELIVDAKNTIEERVFAFQAFVQKWCDRAKKDRATFVYESLQDKLKILELQIEEADS